LIAPSDDVVLRHGDDELHAHHGHAHLYDAGVQTSSREHRAAEREP
jgi:hypothetical protein